MSEEKKPVEKPVEKPVGELKTLMFNGELKKADKDTYAEFAKRKTRWIDCILSRFLKTY